MNDKDTSLVPDSPLDRLLYAVVGLVIPVISFLMGDVLKPDWQSGKFEDYLRLLLSAEVTPIFYPLLLYAAGCLGLMLINPRRFAQYFGVRLGIYSGTILSLHYALIIAGLIFSGGLEGVINFYVGGLLMALFYATLGRKLNSIVTILLLGGVLLTMFVIDDGGFLFSSVLVLSSGPSWCLLMGASISYRLFRVYEMSDSSYVGRGLGGLLWLIAYIITWRWTIHATLATYASLPTRPPSDCYIATAAATGHKRLTHAVPLRCADGRMAAWISPQLRRFKGIELLLLTLCPRFHQALRQIYDRIGPRLAARLVTPFRADVAYCLLKPLEWSCLLLAKIVVADFETFINQLYSPERNSP